MKLIHTADWHLGKHLHRQDRTPEIAFALDQILDTALEHDVDAVIVAGDIFDKKNPPANAYKVAFDFFKRLADANIPVVALAGNHDSGEWIEGAAGFCSLLGIHMIGRPVGAKDGGLIQIRTRSGELLRVAAVPFVSERWLLDHDEIWERDPSEQSGVFREALQYLFKDLATEFRHDSVNVLTAHAMVSGALLSNSESKHHSSEAFSLLAESFGAAAHYVALGHVHKPQQLANPLARYCGSPVQIDFGEADEAKSFNLVECEAGLPASVTQIPLRLSQPLKVVRCHHKDLDDRMEEHKGFHGWLRFDVELDSPRPALKDYVQSVLANALHVDSSTARTTVSASVRTDAGDLNMSPEASLREYYRLRKKSEPTEALTSAFLTLLENASR